MSINHRERVERVVDKALDDARKEAGVLEKPSFCVGGPSIWPVRNEKGEPTGQMSPAWFIVVTLKSGTLGEPDIGNGFPVYGIMPEDQHFEGIARGLLAKCLQEKQIQESSVTLSAAAAEWAKGSKA